MAGGKAAAGTGLGQGEPQQAARHSKGTGEREEGFVWEDPRVRAGSLCPAEFPAARSSGIHQEFPGAASAL